MKHRLAVLAFVCGSTALPVAWAQGYSVMGSGDGAAQQPPPPPPGAQLVVQPAPSAQVAGSSTQTVETGHAIVARRPEEYGGVTPGAPAVPPGFRRRPRAGTLVAWPGFQMVPGGSRVFVVLTAPVPPGDGGRVGRTRVFHLPGARISLSNNRRPLLTEAFNTPVARAFLRPARGGTDVVLELRADVEPSVTHESNAQGYQFVYFNFPAFTAPEPTRIIAVSGDARPVVAPAGTTVSAPAVATPAVVVGAPRPATDVERPPATR